MFVLGQLLVQLSGEELGADCNPAHHCDLEVYERILPGLVMSGGNYKCHIALSSFFWLITFLAYSFETGGMKRHMKKNRTVHLGLSAE